jgi:hypothetical protein
MRTPTFSPEPLRRLLSASKIAYLYCSSDPAARERQLRTRQARPVEKTPSAAGAPVVTEELKAGIVLFYSLLDEKQRRLYAGLEALKQGRGGDSQIAAMLGLDVHTVAKGRRQLLSGELEPDRVRRAGAGRKRVEKKRPK